MELEQAKLRVIDEVDKRSALLIDVSRQIHARPELGFAEGFAHDLLTSVLADEGLAVERGAYGLDTAFAARAGTAGPHIAVICEYDALPGLGHGCGHNVIAAAGLGAGLAAATLAGLLPGRVSVLGTPAEEGGGGKVVMIQRGAFDGVDAAMMIHPAGSDLRIMHTLAIHQLVARYQGRAAHAAAAPDQGINALDAAVLGYVNVAALRQHIRPDERIHGIFTHGGDKPNIVPDRAEAHWYVRSPTRPGLEALEVRVLACLQAGADAAGATLTYEWLEPSYDDMVDNHPLLDLYAANARRLGRVLEEPTDLTAVTGSTDMGNVSHLVPSIHPMIKVAPTGVAIHTADFARAAVSDLADAAVLDGAKAMAMTIVDLWLDPAARRRVAANVAPSVPSIPAAPAATA
jgi:amidohydrolase